MKTRKILLICLISLFTISCEKGLDLQSKDVITDAVYFKTVEDFKLYLNQFYPELPSFNADDDMSDITKPSGFNAVSNSSYVSSPGDGTWDFSYRMIRYANYALESANKASDDIKSGIKVYEAEAKFFRAFHYFNLLKRFGGVPLIDKTLTLNDTEYLYGPRATREAIADFIVKDLDDAIAGLPLESDISASDKGRVSKGAAQALKARMCLFEGTWRKYHGLSDADKFITAAVDASKAVIDSEEYELFDRRDVLGDLSYKYYFTLSTLKANPAGLTKVDQSETILANRYDQDIRESPRYEHSHELCPTKKLADMYLDKNGVPITHASSVFKGYNMVLDEYQDRDPRMDIFFVKPFERFWLFSQPVYNVNWDNPESTGIIYNVDFGFWTQTGYRNLKGVSEISFPMGMDWPVIRYTEVLLIYAEALYEKNGKITDNELKISINKLRDRVSMVHLTNAHVSKYGLDMLTEIRRERTIELSLEGYRLDDLRRWKTAEVELKEPLRGVKFKGTEYETNPLWENVKYDYDAEGCILLEASSKRNFEQKHYLFPLPTRQILLNPALEQNPGWK